MSTLSDEEIYQEVSKIVEPFGLFECFECAQAVIDWLRQNQIHGTMLRLRTKYRDAFILSSRWERLGNTESISSNGIHYGVEVRGQVFDNLSSEGLNKEAWINDFACRRGVFELEEIERV
ncbi:hypothetical protein HC931_09590 [Candidatus Gracilibacteria bacterium]|nr:hypothetical protein [Candidatus Gracilibacteria bacterium]NJM90152.1 hypothetical protein [Hydrococcus sp. RU_2_2]NJP22553.1 hypothetical protein [Hydrococcus sp. CRU_1_1]